MIREPAVAGQFYPAGTEDLRKTIGAFLKAPHSLLDAKAVLCPHAGYVYSGSVAGAVYSAVNLPERLIILGPNHTGRGEALSIYPGGKWRTPLGLVPIDSDLTERLCAEYPRLSKDHVSHRYEHSLEVQLPFLQSLLPRFQFAALCLGTIDYALLEGLGHALARTVCSSAEPVLMISSSDMNHYESAQIASQKDHWAIEQMQKANPQGLYETVLEKNISMCGFGPTVSVLVACRDLGASSGQLLRYGNSGEVNGDFDRVVGYAGMAIL